MDTDGYHSSFNKWENLGRSKDGEMGRESFGCDPVQKDRWWSLGISISKSQWCIFIKIFQNYGHSAISLMEILNIQNNNPFVNTNLQINF